MVDVILAKLDSEEKEYRMPPPFGILYLADALEKEGFSVRLFHRAGTEADVKALVELVCSEEPIFVGFSTLTGPCLRPTLRATKAIKRIRQALPVVWGGLHVTMLPEQTLMNAFVDIAAIGEGERTVVELAKVLRRDGLAADALASVQGIAFRENARVIVNQPRPFIKNLDDLNPAWHLLDDVDRYFPSGRHFYSDIGCQFWGEKIAPVFTSRGCPWRCGFCYNQYVNRRSFRAQSADRVIRDIREYRERYGITAIIFEDDGFFTDKERALEIVRNIGVPWTSTIRANQLAKWGDDFLSELREHHCQELRIGAESGSQHVLDLMMKDITVDDIRTSARLCLKHGIKVSLGFMIGIPGESWQDVLDTLALIDELEGLGDGVSVIGPGIFAPYPGTPLYEAAIKHGFEPPHSVEDWSTRIFDHKQALAPYADKRIKYTAYYRRLSKREEASQSALGIPRKLLSQVARLRWKHRFFRFPLDYAIPAAAVNLLDGVGLRRLQLKLRKAAWNS